MIKQSHFAALTISLGLLSACSSTANRAPVVDRTSVEATKGVIDDSKERDPALYTVKKGDTLIRIALEYGQNYRDLVVWNNLSNPNDIKVDQVLRVQPPEGGAADSGAQTVAVVMPPAETRPAPTPPVPKKTGPRGDKRTYSDAALAELQRADGAPAPAPAPARPERVVSTPAAPAAAAAASAASADDEKLSWMWPSEGRVIATFDEGKNKGIDIAGRAGQHVMAAGAGKVMYAGSGIRGYGNLVIVKHSNSLLSAYAHNRSIAVKEGQSVNKGQMIAEMGDSDADAVKLHFEIRQQGKPVDPSKFLPNR
ncbi:peptidoglycan DD-metalloendopeptidase family protein [Janthinobacterium fluminis]|uniref:Peptidoglycan DD-metalloendopeptidase family protein n=1 Tax=Janthinobacterium fluminis TaxID=2987524 RepID=A0ABT5KAA6_9BURK|nr:peptidoglycan DD-metalloendopeptidase family protein [Janthinobacterium fluminis]MDC8760767.1 peptidoglycan DD-metalloendopeptidase family protein [Janthinobacterium fluminis]